MPRLSIHTPDKASSEPFPNLPGMTAEGSIESHGLVVGKVCPLHLWEHVLSSRSRLTIGNSPCEHTFFVLSGTIRANGKVLIPQSVVVVEHGATMEFEVPGPKATLLHWHKSDAANFEHKLGGGHAHIVGPEGLYEFKDERAVRVWADSTCPTCETWLNCSRPFPPDSVEEPHYHTADEIIYILGGSAIVGHQELEPGSALAIDANTTYKFRAGTGGLQFLNFGAAEPWYVPRPRDGTVPTPIRNLDVVQKFIVRRRGV